MNITICRNKRSTNRGHGPAHGGYGVGFADKCEEVSLIHSSGIVVYVGSYVQKRDTIIDSQEMTLI